jgi:hypothetical protein
MTTSIPETSKSGTRRSRGQLDRARATLRLASQNLDLWHIGASEADYQANGRDAIARLDATMRHLANARAELIGEMRRDQNANTR